MSNNNIFFVIQYSKTRRTKSHASVYKQVSEKNWFKPLSFLHQCVQMKQQITYLLKCALGQSKARMSVSKINSMDLMLQYQMFLLRTQQQQNGTVSGAIPNYCQLLSWCSLSCLVWEDQQSAMLIFGYHLQYSCFYYPNYYD